MTDFATFAQRIIDKLTKEGRNHTAETRKYSANRLLMFMGDNPTPMDKWDDLFVLDYETWLKTQGAVDIYNRFLPVAIVCIL